MKTVDNTDCKKKNILAAVGSLFLVALMCGCGHGENTILIGTAGEQKIEIVSDADEEASFLQKGQSEFPQEKAGFQKGQSEFPQEKAEFQQGQSELPQEQSGFQQGQSEFQQEQLGQMMSEGQNIWSEEQMLSYGQQILLEQGTDTKEEVLIRIYVCGAVVNPGVVSVPAGSRVEDALLEAGGFTSEAMRQAVNLADWVFDGQMLYFPAKGEDLNTLISGGWSGYGFGGGQGSSAGRNTSIGSNMSGGQSAGAGLNVSGGQSVGAGQNAGGGQSVVTGQSQASGLVNINTADAAELVTLPGIGESRAQDIIAYREKNGGFANCEDIMKVSGIKTSVYEKICDRITVK